MKKIIFGFVLGSILFAIPAESGVIDMMQREGQTNQLQTGNALMVENNKLIKESNRLLAAILKTLETR